VGLLFAPLALLLSSSPAHASPEGQPYGSCTVTSAAVSNPAAGTSTLTVLTVPAGHYYDVGSVQFTSSLANAGGAREQSIRISDGTRDIWRNGTTVAINQAVAFQAGAATNPNSGNSVLLPLPQITLQPGWSIKAVDAGANAGDQFSAITYTVCDGVAATEPTHTVHVDNPQTSVTVSNPVTSVTVTNPQTSVTVSNFPTSVTISNPQTSVTVTGTVTVGNTVDIAGTITATANPACGAAAATTTTLAGADDRMIPCVQPVQLDDSSNVTLWVALALVLLACGLGFGIRLVKS